MIVKTCPECGFRFVISEYKNSGGYKCQCGNWYSDIPYPPRNYDIWPSSNTVENGVVWLREKIAWDVYSYLKKDKQ